MDRARARPVLGLRGIDKAVVDHDLFPGMGTLVGMGGYTIQNPVTS